MLQSQVHCMKILSAVVTVLDAASELPTIQKFSFVIKRAEDVHLKSLIPQFSITTSIPVVTAQYSV